MKNPDTQEYFEAEQSAVDKQRTEIAKLLDDEGRKKYDLVEECCEKMVKAEVPFYMFTILPLLGNETVIQYNSFATLLAKYDENLKLTEESKDVIHEKSMKVMASVFYHFAVLPHMRQIERGEIAPLQVAQKFGEQAYYSFCHYFLKQPKESTE
jgi:hypothetical protein